jgi:hypothetical protein
VIEWLLGPYPFQTVFLILGVAVLSVLLFLPLLAAPPRASKAELEEPMGTVLNRAFRDPSFTLIFLGFFSCGYQLGFITAHFPAFVTESVRSDRAGRHAGRHGHHHDLGARRRRHRVIGFSPTSRARWRRAGSATASRRSTCSRRSTRAAPSPPPPSS